MSAESELKCVKYVKFLSAKVFGRGCQLIAGMRPLARPMGHRPPERD